MIRVANKSDSEIEDIILTFHSPSEQGGIDSQLENYGDLAPGEMTAYRLIGSSYGYMPVSASINGRQLRLGITDYLGEPLIPDGNYTHVLTYDSDADELVGQLEYQQTDLDSAIDKALDEKIAEQALYKYYVGEPYREGGEALSCVHQQTHRENGEESAAVVYAWVTCFKSSLSTEAGEISKKLILIPEVPVRFELEKIEDSFVVVDYQSPHTVRLPRKEMRKLFPPQLIEDMGDFPIREATFNKLKLKARIDD